MIWNKNKIKKVEKYYNELTKSYISSGYGDIIQAHRPPDPVLLLQYLSKNARIKNGMKILDAGCGICGPAIFFAKNFDIHITSITNSLEQVKVAKSKIENELLNDKIEVLLADYHKLYKLFAKESFDLVIMLESYGHAVNKFQVLSGVDYVLRKEGNLYIKDYFQKEITGSKERRKGMIKAIKNMNKCYCYNLPDINQTLKILRNLNLELQYVKKNELQVETQNFVRTFEAENNIDLFDGGFHYLFLEPLELYFRKPTDIDELIL